MTEAAIYSTDGKKTGRITLPEKVFGLPWNTDLVHQVVVSMRSNARTAVAHTKDRSDVRGGGKKPWKQKGTGRARHGSSRSPIWKGGGVTHGPRNERNFDKKINKKMRVKALYSVLSQKLRDNEILFVDAVNFSAPKTADAKKMLASLSSVSGFESLNTKRKNAAYIAVNKTDENAMRSFRNFGNIAMGDVRNLNPSGVLDFKYLIITDPSESVEAIMSRMGRSSTGSPKKPRKVATKDENTETKSKSIKKRKANTTKTASKNSKSTAAKTKKSASGEVKTSGRK